jgi:hypothetical protein
LLEPERSTTVARDARVVSLQVTVSATVSRCARLSARRAAVVRAP